MSMTVPMTRFGSYLKTRIVTTILFWGFHGGWIFGKFVPRNIGTFSLDGGAK